MGNLLAYSGTATKIRGMRRKLLTAKDFQHLASLTSVSDAIGFLKTKSAYAGIFANSNENSLHRGEIEKMLTNAIYTDFQSIYRFATIHQRKILDLYFRRYEIGLLKTCMRMVFDHRDVELNFDIFKDFFAVFYNTHVYSPSFLVYLSILSDIVKIPSGPGLKFIIT